MNPKQSLFQVINELYNDEIYLSELRKEAREKQIKEAEYKRWILNGKKFEINIFEKTQSNAGCKVDVIPIEGCSNAIKIFEQYRSIGHSIGIDFMELYLDDKKIKKVTFKYSKA